MDQKTIPGFPTESLYVQTKKHLEKNGPEATIDFLGKQGYYWLSDKNSGIFLTGGVPEKPEEAYIPYRIEFPDKRILDEREIYGKIEVLENQGFTKESILVARILEECVNDDETNKDKFKWINETFVSKDDELNTLKKYFEKPFYEYRE
jgi:hypothetical protein